MYAWNGMICIFKLKQSYMLIKVVDWNDNWCVGSFTFIANNMKQSTVVK